MSMSLMSHFPFCPVCGHAYDAANTTEFSAHCVNCDYTYYESLRTTTSAAIFANNQLVLVRRAVDPQKGTWDFPGGFVTPNEHPEEGIRREIREEMGVEITIDRLYSISAPGLYPYKGFMQYTCDHFYIIQPHSLDFKLADDIDDCQYFKREELTDESRFFDPIILNLRKVYADDALWQ